MNILSIDPGLTGGFAEFNSYIAKPAPNQNKFLSAAIMPTNRILIKPKQMQFDLDYSTTKSGKKQFIKSGPNKGQPKMKMKSPAKYKKELNIKVLYKLFQEQDVIIIEKQNPQPGNSAASSASTMRNYGKLLALAELSEAKLVLVAPMTWKKHFGLALSKQERKLMTPKEYKDLSIHKAYNLSNFNTSYDGISDAICIGYWYLQTTNTN
ncbi:MAG: hypothetical protein J7L15_04975 [Clostridiales bacterium]|nr:hypothetical protein [Clostridiales bacterium]